MKVRLLLLIVLFSPLYQAQAAGNTLYWLPKAGLYNVLIDDATPMQVIGLGAGYGLSPFFALEAEAMYAMNKSQFDNAREGEGRYHISSIGLYAVMRARLPAEGLYYKTRLGVSYEQVLTERLSDDFTREQTNNSLSGGLGLGFHADGITLELEWTQIEKNIAAFQLGVHYPLAWGR